MNEKRTVCLISGGLDSSVSAFIAKKLDYNIYTLSFNYGQQHGKELQCAKKISTLIKAKKHIIFNLDIDLFGGSSLYKGKFKKQKKKISEIGKVIPSTYVPARNTIFLSIALAYAEVINANSIFIGVNSTDYSGYPDCRPEYIKAFQNLADIATKKSIEGNIITIKTPLINLSKSQIIRKGYDLNVPFEETWSCYKGGYKACGECDSCLLRLKGFKKSNIKDPIKYETLPEWYK
jgi:7-cyano-7-deazaguanine synthase